MPSRGKQRKSMGIWVKIWKSIPNRTQGTGSDMAWSLMCPSDRRKTTVTRAKITGCVMKGDKAVRGQQGLNHIGP